MYKYFILICVEKKQKHLFFNTKTFYFFVDNNFFLILTQNLDRSQYQLGSLSHMIDCKASGYQELPDFPEEQPDPTVRNVEVNVEFCGKKSLYSGTIKSIFFLKLENDNKRKKLQHIF